MPLSLLSDGFVSDSFNDCAVARHDRRPTREPGWLHFDALCRGVAVLLTVVVPLVLTALATGTADIADAAGHSAAPQASITRAKAQG